MANKQQNGDCHMKDFKHWCNLPSVYNVKHMFQLQSYILKQEIY